MRLSKVSFCHGLLSWNFITINEPVDYMAQAVMILLQGKDITRAIGRVGLKVEPVLGPVGPKQARQFDWYFYAIENRVDVSGPKHFTALVWSGGARST